MVLSTVGRDSNEGRTGASRCKRLFCTCAAPQASGLAGAGVTGTTDWRPFSYLASGHRWRYTPPCLTSTNVVARSGLFATDDSSFAGQPKLRHLAPLESAVGPLCSLMGEAGGVLFEVRMPTPMWRSGSKWKRTRLFDHRRILDDNPITHGRLVHGPTPKKYRAQLY